MDDNAWIPAYFDQMSSWAEQRPWPRNDEQAASVERLTGPGAKDVLELGCGEGITAVAMAALGHRVTAVDLSPVRIGIARRRAEAAEGPQPTFLQGDFLTVAPDSGPFDCVVCFNCFGTGTDAEQRRVLRRVADEWLRPGGRAVIDVYGPWRWAASAGKTTRGRHGVELVNYNDFDPVNGRWLDRWWPVGEPEKAVTQYGRAYTPADFALLVDGTGLTVERAELDGEPLDLAAEHDAASPLWQAWEYRVVLRHERSE
ncbi:class I SAM-dependent methyltransferase [Streptomyces litchfieldiae]|uniref:Class I SAM-dependent methyltransferase n=1 Tax=Streptomyces litchfieldiae TaxID=3075543 RepID=A0ABU2MUK6_9ACTN|nr:class I SAM-dependent methyltransferase [Streptomyces sp. DSM 44938]MDT0344774.1 class I SAM-dependent methyltransferase [Streptomyces sp. DSM 44938]